jgi:hypothetical protein
MTKIPLSAVPAKAGSVWRAFVAELFSCNGNHDAIPKVRVNVKAAFSTWVSNSHLNVRMGNNRLYFIESMVTVDVNALTVERQAYTKTAGTLERIRRKWFLNRVEW